MKKYQTLDEQIPMYFGYKGRRELEGLIPSRRQTVEELELEIKKH